MDFFCPHLLRVALVGKKLRCRYYVWPEGPSGYFMQKGENSFII